MHDVSLLTMEEKLIVSYIWSWQIQGKCCFASDDFLAEALGVSTPDIRKTILSLASRNKITITRATSSTARMLSMRQYNGVDPCVSEMDLFDV